MPIRGRLRGQSPGPADPGEGLAQVEVLDRYYLFHATRAALLRRLGRADEAREADARALAGTQNPAERALIEGRLHPQSGIPAEPGDQADS